MASILGVDKIQHTNGTDAITIDSTGRIHTPARPSIFADCSTGASAAYVTVSNGAAVQFVNKISGSGITLSSATFTVPVAGLYQINASFLNNNEENMEFSLKLNSAYALVAFQSDERRINMSHAMELSANDTIQFINTSGYNLGVHRNTDATDRYTAVSMYLVG